MACIVSQNEIQSITFNIEHHAIPCKIALTVVYAKCTQIIIGDFNVVRTSEQKIGGNPIDLNATAEFNNSLNLNA